MLIDLVVCRPSSPFQARFLDLGTTSGPRSFFVVGGGPVLGAGGCSAASLASTHRMPGAPPNHVLTTKDVSRHCQAESHLVENHCPGQLAP